MSHLPFRPCAVSLTRSLAGPMRARYSLTLWLPLALACWMAVGAAAQPGYSPEFGVELVTRKADAATRLDVHTSVPNSSLRFLARAGGFEARYGLTVQVYALDDRDRRQELVASRTSEREVSAADYDATQADREDLAVQALDVPPGRYLVAVSVEDAASGRALAREIRHTVRDVSAAVALSDPVLLSEYDRSAGLSTPIVGSTVSTEQDAFWVSAEAYAAAGTPLQVTYLVTEQSRVQERPSFGALLGLAPRQQADSGTPVAVTEAVTAQPGATPAAFRIATEGLQVGDYVLTVRLADAQGQALAEVDKPFAVRWTGLDGQIADLDEAIDQLSYLARPDDIRAIRNAPTPQAQRQRFLAFWSARDPTPGTPRNESMEQYYFRVAYANDRYSRFHDRGWSTDRGEVFIRFGEPDAVEDHPVDYGTRPYQVWTYQGRGRRFIFVDKTGSGDFELLVPIWDDRTRM